MTHEHLTGAHLRRAPIYQPPDVEPIPLDDEPPTPIELAPWIGFIGWALAAIMFGVWIGRSLP